MTSRSEEFEKALEAACAAEQLHDPTTIEARCYRLGFRAGYDARAPEVDRLRRMYESAEQSSDNWHKEAERLRAENEKAGLGLVQQAAEHVALHERDVREYARVQQRAEQAEARVRELEAEIIKVKLDSAEVITAYVGRLEQAERERDELRKVVEAVTGIIEALGQTLANITATKERKGMQVPWHGPFTVALTHPSTMRDLLNLHGALARALLAPKETNSGR